jgi:steroid delta-isomerase-like uncharacterized protein
MAIDIVKNYYHAFNQKNWEGMLALLDTNVRHDANQGASYYGLEHFRHFLQHMERCYDEQLKDMVFMADASGERFACEFVVHGRYIGDDEGLPPAKGQVYVLPAGAFLEMRNNKITRVTTYYNLQDWIKMVS